MIKLSAMAQILDELEEYKKLISLIENKKLPLNIVGVSESAVAHLVFCVQKKLMCSGCIVAPDNITAKKLQQDLEEFYDNVLYFPETEYIFYDIEALNQDISSQRLNVLYNLANNKNDTIVITTINALLQPTMPLEQFKSGLVSLK